MQNVKKANDGTQRILDLIEEVLNGAVKKDILINSSYDFSEEVQAAYYSNMRNNMKSDMAFAVMNSNQELHDLEIVEVLR